MIRGVTVRGADSRYLGITGPLYWTIFASTARELPAPDSLRYAMPPAGFSGGPAALLIPGNYRIEVQIGAHTAITYFKIDPDGHATS